MKVNLNEIQVKTNYSNVLLFSRHCYI